MMKRKEGVEGAVFADTRPCAKCGHFVSFHLLRRQDRLEIYPQDDNHVFQPFKVPGVQMRLPFGVIPIKTEMPVPKIPPQRQVQPARLAARKARPKAR